MEGFKLDVIGCHVDVKVVPMIITKKRILFIYFDLNSFMSITNIKLI